MVTKANRVADGYKSKQSFTKSQIRVNSSNHRN